MIFELIQLNIILWLIDHSMLFLLRLGKFAV